MEGMQRDHEEMKKKTSEIGVQADGESAYSVEARAKIEEVRSQARLEGQDEDEAVRNFNDSLSDEERARLYGTNEGMVN